MFTFLVSLERAITFVGRLVWVAITRRGAEGLRQTWAEMAWPFRVLAVLMTVALVVLLTLLPFFGLWPEGLLRP